ncbi:MAG: diaminobutyrate acetyltransferase [Porticoccaceae bacterium]|nr:MAG: diaminobutyrate acetyltransferase [Porticoccaceae bacterium]
MADSALQLRHPTVEDGLAVWRLVGEAGTLDRNSCYLYLLLCREFADTCVVAERLGEIEGFVTGFRPPRRPEAWFLWQVGVAPQARGQGLAARMVHFLLERLAGTGVRWLETTVSPGNAASRALFEGVARRLEVPLVEEPLFESRHFPAESNHEPEPLLRIGPFDSVAARAARNRLSSA